MKSISKWTCFGLLVFAWVSTFFISITFLIPGLVAQPRSLGITIILFIFIGFMQIPLGFAQLFMEYSFLRNYPDAVSAFVIAYWISIVILHIIFVKSKNMGWYFLLCVLLFCSAGRASWLFQSYFGN